MLAIMSPLPDTEGGLGGRTWSQDGLVGLELEAEPTEAAPPVAAPLWEACMPTPEQEGSPPRHRARSVRFAVDEPDAQPFAAIAMSLVGAASVVAAATPASRALLLRAAGV